MKYTTTVKAEIEQIQKISDFIEENINADTKTKAQLCICVDEIMSNIAKFAYSEQDSNNVIDLEINDDNGFISIIFEDYGKEFNPLLHENPDVSQDVSTRPIGGLGIMLVKTMMDNVTYKRTANKNILTISKKI